MGVENCNGNSNWWLTSHRYTAFKWPGVKPKWDHWDLHQSRVLLGVRMMLSLLEVLHQLPTPQGGGGYHKNYGGPAGPQQCWSTVCPACKRGSSTLRCSPTAIIRCINEWVLLLDTESHRATAHRNTWHQTISNGFTQKMCFKPYYPIYQLVYHSAARACCIYICPTCAVVVSQFIQQTAAAGRIFLIERR